MKLKATISSAVNTDDSGNTYLAVGISVVWEAHMTYYIDDIEVTVN